MSVNENDLSTLASRIGELNRQRDAQLSKKSFLEEQINSKIEELKELGVEIPSSLSLDTPQEFLEFFKSLSKQYREKVEQDYALTSRVVEAAERQDYDEVSRLVNGSSEPLDISDQDYSEDEEEISNSDEAWMESLSDGYEESEESEKEEAPPSVNTPQGVANLFNSVKAPSSPEKSIKGFRL